MGSRGHNDVAPDQSEEDKDQNPETMSSWISRTVGSHQAQLVATAAVSGALVAGAILGYQHVRRQALVEDLKRSIPGDDEEHVIDQLTDYGAASSDVTLNEEDEKGMTLALRAQRGDYDQGLILEQLARNRVFLTDAGLGRLRASCVIVVGCGGVGSHASAALARSGVGQLRLIDFDQVTLSSLNRHALATLADVGTPKVHCIRRRLEQVTPWVRFDCRNELFSESAASRLLQPFAGEAVDYVIDAIDNVDSKVALLAYCVKHSLPVISSMGAGCKSDPTRVSVGDISASIEDPLSRSTRRRLRALGVQKGVPVVYSTEKPGPGKAQLLPLPEEEFVKGGVGELSVLPDFRARILPVLGTMPAVFGYTAANQVILDLTRYPHEEVPAKGREKTYESVLSSLQSSEERLASAMGEDVIGLKIPVTRDDVGYLVEEVYRGRSVISGLSTRLALVRWEAPGEDLVDKRTHGQKFTRLCFRDLVCMTKEEAASHEKRVLKGHEPVAEVYNDTVLQLVEQRRQEQEWYARFR
ncbi:MAG: hypothetical protein M1838_006071 [Thelocarpon superellum]|nr:MAG: hypothetical protein M1838_006071 [Thelocarpon superellum]